MYNQIRASFDCIIAGDASLFFCTILFLDLEAGGQDPLTSSKL